MHSPLVTNSAMWPPLNSCLGATSMRVARAPLHGRECRHIRVFRSQNKWEAGSVSTLNDFILMLLCLILCCWHWVGWTMFVNITDTLCNNLLWYVTQKMERWTADSDVFCAVSWCPLRDGLVRDSPTFTLILGLFHQKTLNWFGLINILKLITAVYSVSYREHHYFSNFSLNLAISQ